MFWAHTVVVAKPYLPCCKQVHTTCYVYLYVHNVFNVYVPWVQCTVAVGLTSMVGRDKGVANSSEKVCANSKISGKYAKDSVVLKAR